MGDVRCLPPPLLFLADRPARVVRRGPKGEEGELERRGKEDAVDQDFSLNR